MDEELPVLEYWYAALNEPLGLVIKVTNAQRLRTELYAARREAGDDRLASLMIITNPDNPNGELWIAHRNVEVDLTDDKN